MKVYTCQMSKWREAARLGIHFLDITVKSGDSPFAPTWDFLMEYKKDLDEDKYIKKFTILMRKSYAGNKSRWLEVCNMEAVVLACYCKAGKFCHRHLVVDMLEKVCNNEGIDFERGEEL